MLVYKCDICNKEIKKGSSRYKIEKDYQIANLCEKCAKPIELFIKKHKLLK